MWQCPTCKSTNHLEVVIEVWAKLIQPDDEPDAFQTDQDEASSHDQEWGENSPMMCQNFGCKDQGECHTAEYFEVEEDDEESETT